MNKLPELPIEIEFYHEAPSGYTTDQMEAYGLACALWAFEEAAKYYESRKRPVIAIELRAQAAEFKEQG